MPGGDARPGHGKERVACGEPADRSGQRGARTHTAGRPGSQGIGETGAARPGQIGVGPDRGGECEQGAVGSCRATRRGCLRRKAPRSPAVPCRSPPRRRTGAPPHLTIAHEGVSRAVGRISAHDTFGGRIRRDHDPWPCGRAGRVLRARPGPARRPGRCTRCGCRPCSRRGCRCRAAGRSAGGVRRRPREAAGSRSRAGTRRSNRPGTSAGRCPRGRGSAPWVHRASARTSHRAVAGRSSPAFCVVRV